MPVIHNPPNRVLEGRHQGVALLLVTESIILATMMVSVEWSDYYYSLWSDLSTTMYISMIIYFVR